MQIQVTQADIDQGREYMEMNRQRCSYCPVALAAARALKEDVLATFLFIRRIRDNERFSLPEAARDWICAFDGGNKVMKPLSFELDLDNPIKSN